MSRLVIFDVWSRFASFRRHYTTTTASTHPFIPRSAVEGLVGAMCGYSSQEYPDLLWDAKIAVSIQSSENKSFPTVSKLPFGVSYTHSDFWTQQVGRYLRRGVGPLNHIPVPRSTEIIEEPKYRLFFSTDRVEVFDKLKQNLKQHFTHYTPYLGSSNMIANFMFQHETEFSLVRCSEDQEIPIQSILPFFQKMPRVKAEPDSRFAIEQNIPLHLSVDRRSSGFYSAVYSLNPGQSIICSGISFAKVTLDKSDVNVVFIPTTPSAS